MREHFHTTEELNLAMDNLRIEWDHIAEEMKTKEMFEDRLQLYDKLTIVVNEYLRLDSLYKKIILNEGF